MEVLHETENPGSGILASLLETLHGRSLALITDSVALHTAVCQLTFLWLQPSSRQWSIRQKPEAKEGDNSSRHTFHDEKPAPAADAMYIVKTSEDAGGNQARETSGENLCAVKKCDS